jgi:translation elongation factor EF-G
LERCIKDL